jgi:hypothetical protein
MAPEPTAVSIKYFVKRGKVIVSTLALEPDDPDHPYNQVIAQGGTPEAFGVEHPRNEEFAGKSRGELIEEIMRLRKRTSDEWGSRW